MTWPQTMSASYTQWIADYVERTPHLLGRCIDASAEMKQSFPELEIVRGHVYCGWGKRGHVWCKAPDGTIVDPTVQQFPSVVEYEPWAPGDEVRVGKCMNCGDDIWRPVQTLDQEPSMESACNSDCEAALMSGYLSEFNYS